DEQILEMMQKDPEIIAFMKAKIIPITPPQQGFVKSKTQEILHGGYINLIGAMAISEFLGVMLSGDSKSMEEWWNSLFGMKFWVNMAFFEAFMGVSATTFGYISKLSKNPENRMKTQEMLSP